DHGLGAPEGDSERLELAVGERRFGTPEKFERALEHQHQQPTAIRGGDLRLLILSCRRKRRAHRESPPSACWRNAPWDCRLLTRTSRAANRARKVASNASRLRSPVAMSWSSRLISASTASLRTLMRPP